MSDGLDEDGRLVAAFVESGRVENFERLVERHQRTVFRVIVSVLGPGRERDAEDVTQDVFVQVYRRLSSFERRSRFSTWLYRIAYNRALDVRRRGCRDCPLLAARRADASPDLGVGHRRRRGDPGTAERGTDGAVDSRPSRRHLALTCVSRRLYLPASGRAFGVASAPSGSLKGSTGIRSYRTSRISRCSVPPGA